MEHPTRIFTGIIVFLVLAGVIGFSVYRKENTLSISQTEVSTSSIPTTSDTVAQASVVADGTTTVFIESAGIKGTSMYIKVRPIGDVSPRPIMCDSSDSPYVDDAVFALKGMYVCNGEVYALRKDIPEYTIVVPINTVVHQFEPKKDDKDYWDPKLDSENVPVIDFIGSASSTIPEASRSSLGYAAPYELKFKDKVLVSITPIWWP